MSSNKTNWPGSASAAVSILTAALAIAGFSPARAAKPSKPPPPPPSPAPYSYLNLGSLDGGYGTVRAINSAGQVVGQSTTAEGAQHAFIVVPLDTNGDGKPDLWNPTGTPQGANPHMIDLGVPAGVEGAALTYPMDINDLGQVVGYCHGPNYSSALGPWVITPIDTGDDGQLDTWYQDANGDGVNDLLVGLGQARTLSGDLVNLQPRDINDGGQIVGTIPPGPSGGRDTPFLLTPKPSGSAPVWFEDVNGDGENDLILRLPLPVSGAESFASVINPAGTVAGAYRNSRGFMRAMLWKPDAQGVMQFTDLGVPKNEEHSGAHGINDSGQVVGFAHTYGAKAVYLKASGWLWQNGVMTDVRTLMDKASELSGLKMKTLGVNNAGLMIGWTSSSETTSPRWPWIAVPIP